MNEISINSFSVYDLYDLDLPQVPPRSQFYCLDPLGVGTAQVESLSSYIMRLACAHCLTASEFFRQVLSQSGENTYKSKESYIYDSSKYIYAINGVSDIGKRWVVLLEQITGQTELLYLTMLSWQNVFPLNSSILRTKRAWCPACYEMWYRAEQPMRDLLIWNLKEVTVCAQHLCFLQTQCSACLQHLPPFSSQEDIGYCPKCHTFLGLSREPERVTSDDIDADTFEELMWVAQVLGELIAITPMLPAPVSQQRVSSTLLFYLHNIANGHKRTLIRQLGLTARTFNRLVQMVQRTNMNMLLQMCKNLDTTPIHFLTGDLSIQQVPICNITPGPFYANELKVDDQSRLNQLRQALEAELDNNEFPPPSLHEVVKRVGSQFHTVSQLFPDLSRKITARYRKFHGKEDNNVELALQEALTNQADDPPSLSEIAKSFGLSPTSISYLFPELTQLLTERQKYLKKEYLDRLKRTLEEAIANEKIPSVTVEQVVQQTGCSRSVLRRHFPELIRGLTAKERHFVEAETLRQRLQPYLQPVDAEPISLREVGRLLGIQPYIIRDRCPEEAKAIVTRYRTYQRYCSQERIQQVVNEVRRVTFEVYAEGIYPGRDTVMERLRQPEYMRNTAVRAAWQEAKTELGLS